MAHMHLLFLWKAFLKVLRAHYFLKSAACRQRLLKLKLTTKIIVSRFFTQTRTHIQLKPTFHKTIHFDIFYSNLVHFIFKNASHNPTS